MRIAIVGAGITGITLANLLKDCHSVSVIEQTNHIGGACYDEYNEYGVLVQKFGAHLFHTNDKQVWDYLSQFTDWRNYIHRVVSCVSAGVYVGVPYRSRGYEFEHWSYETYKKYIVDPYVAKRWDDKFENLPESITKRMDTTDQKDFMDIQYFHDKYQGVPIGGYTLMFSKMLDGIQIMLNTKFKYDDMQRDFDKIIYTGCVDYLLNDSDAIEFCNPLPYVRLDFKHKTEPTPDMDCLLPYPIVNYPSMFDYTRVHESRQFTGQITDHSTLTYEFPHKSQSYMAPSDELYYPYPGGEEQAKVYRATAKEMMPKIIFAGRMGLYQYIDMDKAVAQAIKLAGEL